MSVAFKKATRQQVKLKLAISGPSGSGKTWGALELAKGLGGRVAVIDTENGSASLYADRWNFDSIEMHAPFTVDKFKAAIDAAVSEKYDVLVIDSISHEWVEVLAEKDRLDASGGKDAKNKFANWAKPTAEHERFKAAVIQAPIHIIATMRSKMEYDISSGKPVKLGLAPIQREGMEYEFSVVFDIAMDHEAVASKDRSALFDRRRFKLTESIGKELAAWMNKGDQAPPAEATFGDPGKPSAFELLLSQLETAPTLTDLEALALQCKSRPADELPELRAAFVTRKGDLEAAVELRSAAGATA